MDNKMEKFNILSKRLGGTPLLFVFLSFCWIAGCESLDKYPLDSLSTTVTDEAGINGCI